MGVGDVMAQQLVERQGLRGHHGTRTVKMMAIGFCFVVSVSSWQASGRVLGSTGRAETLPPTLTPCGPEGHSAAPHLLASSGPCCRQLVQDSGSAHPRDLKSGGCEEDGAGSGWCHREEGAYLEWYSRVAWWVQSYARGQVSILL